MLSQVCNNRTYHLPSTSSPFPKQKKGQDGLRAKAVTYQGTHSSSGGDAQWLRVLGHLGDGCSPRRGQHWSAAQHCAALHPGSEVEGAGAERATCSPTGTSAGCQHRGATATVFGTDGLFVLFCTQLFTWKPS